MRPASLRPAVAVATLGGLVALAHPGGAGASKHSPSGLELHRIARFAQPTYAGQAPGRPRTLYVAEQQGRILAVRGGRELRRPFLDIRKLVGFGPKEVRSVEAGLYSFAFDPAYQRNRRVYVFYTGLDGNNHLDRFRRSREHPLHVVRGSRRRVLTVLHPYTDSHNGGQLQFGPDGMLWLSTGDGGCCGDRYDQARSLGTLLGKLLRIDPRPRRGGYRVPPDNPLASVPGSEPIYSWGLRNAWRFSFDRATGALAIADVGDNETAREEINFLSPGAAQSANFGWPEYEGHRLNDPERPGQGKRIEPIAEYAHEHSECAITGGYVVRDPRLPQLYGRYVYSDYCGGRIRSLIPPTLAEDGLPTAGASDVRDEGLYLRYPASFAEGRNGRIYVVSGAGPVYRLRSKGR